MAPDLLSALYILLITSTLSGIPALSTVTEVSVKTGQTITIPCLYDQSYSNHVKYWCRYSGTNFFVDSCSFVVRTDDLKTTGKTLISEDVKQNIFTVSMNNLQMDDAGPYWCGIEKIGLDVTSLVNISVSQGSDRLYVDQQKVTAVEGLDATIRCYYGNAGSMKWCQLGGSCVNGGSGSLDGVSVELRRTNGNVLVVTLRGLKRRHTGWYWCAVGGLQMPVHITVNEETGSRTRTRTTRTTSTTGTTSTRATTSRETGGANGHTEDDQRSGRIVSYLLRTGSALFFFLCTVIAVVIIRANRRRGEAD